MNAITSYMPAVSSYADLVGALAMAVGTADSVADKTTMQMIDVRL